jgi:uncharacterized protein
MDPTMQSDNFQRDYNSLFNKNWRVKSFKKAMPLLLWAARDGYSHAQNLVGYAFDSGLACRRSSKKAVYWYRKAARSGSDESLYNLALHLVKGDGLPRNPRKALDLYKRAARKGHVEASSCYRMVAEGSSER